MSPYMYASLIGAIVLFLAGVLFGRWSVGRLLGKILTLEDLPFRRPMVMCGMVDGSGETRWVRFADDRTGGFLVHANTFNVCPCIGDQFEVIMVSSRKNTKSRAIQIIGREEDHVLDEMVNNQPLNVAMAKTV